MLGVTMTYCCYSKLTITTQVVGLLENFSQLIARLKLDVSLHTMLSTTFRCPDHHTDWIKKINQ